MTTLTEFLLARIAEDEAPSRVRVRPEFVNRVVYLSTGYAEGSQRMLDGKVMTEEEWAAITEPVPPTARVLAECDAKRRIVEMAVDGYEYNPNPTLRYLAAVYADHPDYREEWRP